ncbi:MAG: response regulator [Bacillota bacterium]
MNILSVDDVMVVRKIIKHVVEGMGGSLIEASSGMEAFVTLEKDPEKIDLILLDWNMPNMNGLEFLAKIKSSEKLKHIPVVMVTNEGEKGKIIKAIQAGASNYLVKPFTEQDLTKKIVDCLGLGYESVVSGCFFDEIKKMLTIISGQEVIEEKSPEDEGIFAKGSLMCSIPLFGQKNAIIFISASLVTAVRLFMGGDDSKAPESDRQLVQGFVKLINKITSEVVEKLAKSNANLNIINPVVMSGIIEDNYFFVNKVKYFKVAKRLTSGDVVLDVIILYF